jgi:alpha-ketoglutaric semialdehyde dehydrogenase
MHIKGEMIITRDVIFGMAGQAQAIDPARHAPPLEPAFGLATDDDVQRACALAAEAFDTYRETAPEQRAAFLERIADNILDIGPSR